MFHKIVWNCGACLVSTAAALGAAQTTQEPLQRPNPARVIEQFDKNGDRMLDETEAPLPMRARFTQLDTNKDGKLGIDELRAGQAGQNQPGNAAGRGDTLFRLLDANSDNRLSRAELEAAVDLVKALDRDKSGAIESREIAGGLRRGNRPGELVTPAAKGERKDDTLTVGDAAPDFSLPELRSKREITLSSYRGKRPVVLIFASYT